MIVICNFTKLPESHLHHNLHQNTACAILMWKIWFIRSPDYMAVIVWHHGWLSAPRFEQLRL